MLYEIISASADRLVRQPADPCKIMTVDTVDGYSRSLRNATGPVDVYVYIDKYASDVYSHIVCTHALCINIA